VPEVVEGIQRPTRPVLIAVVSSSESIRAWAATLLGALGFGPDCAIIRNPREPGWAEGLAACDIVGADVVAARELPASVRPIVFRIVSEASLAELRQLAAAECDG
jgi:hypothetical protein